MVVNLMLRKNSHDSSIELHSSKEQINIRVNTNFFVKLDLIPATCLTRQPCMSYCQQHTHTCRCDTACELWWQINAKWIRFWLKHIDAFPEVLSLPACSRCPTEETRSSDPSALDRIADKYFFFERLLAIHEIGRV
jgi:hypothetical protein